MVSAKMGLDDVTYPGGVKGLRLSVDNVSPNWVTKSPENGF